MHDDVGAEVQKHARQPCSDVLEDYIDGSAYSSHPLFSKDPSAVRLHMYIDEFEVCNPIGSRKGVHKLTAIYYIIRNVHPKYWSQSSVVHLALLARTQIIKQYGLEVVLAPLIEDLKTLETQGVCVDMCGNRVVLYGSIATISADNLGSHQLGGFRLTFSSGKLCRYGLTDAKNLTDHVSEDSCVLRTADGHADHLRGITRDSTLIATYGVTMRCKFDELAYFQSWNHYHLMPCMIYLKVSVQ